MKKLLLIIISFLFCLSVFATGHTVSLTTTTAITCYGSCNGAMSATVSGGVGPFTYAWSPSGGTGPTASSLCAGSYTVTVTDNSDMSTATASAVITQPPLLSISTSG